MLMISMCWSTIGADGDDQHFVMIWLWKYTDDQCHIRGSSSSSSSSSSELGRFSPDCAHYCSSTNTDHRPSISASANWSAQLADDWSSGWWSANVDYLLQTNATAPSDQVSWHLSILVFLLLTKWPSDQLPATWPLVTKSRLQSYFPWIRRSVVCLAISWSCYLPNTINL